MLILARKVNDSVMVGDNVKITVMSVKGQQVRLAFEAPDDVKIHREEIYLRIQNGEPRPEPKEAIAIATVAEG